MPMFDSLIRKSRQVASDPVLRRWLAGRLLGRHGSQPSFTAHHPPYAENLLPLAPENPSPPLAFRALDGGAPSGPLHLPLAGVTVTVQPHQVDGLFASEFTDTETLLSLHRFAWLPLLGNDADPAWVAALWAAWRRGPGQLADDWLSGGWAWHPYTAAERVINILDFARREGLPGEVSDTLHILAAHGPNIARQLEYFGDHHTSNHLANNGRGLFRLGLELGLPLCARLGGRILAEEAARIFHPSGVLREGSSHYHLLVTRNYVDAWLAARRFGAPEEEKLKSIAQKALAAATRLMLPGGFPLIGDISPDCPPQFLSPLSGGGSGGWLALLNDDDRAAVAILQGDVTAAGLEVLAADGWLRMDAGPWSGMWHGSPGGWSAMPGHGHQDWGGFELHYEDEAVFVDPGRGAYGDDGEAGFYVSARAHNSLLINGMNPYPPNKPYYGRGFRDAVGGPPPELVRTEGGVRARHHGFARFKGIGAVDRQWVFSDRTLTLTDSIGGKGEHAIEQMLHTPLAVEPAEDGVCLRGRRRSYRLRTDGPVSLSPGKLWIAYGRSRPGTVIRITRRTPLPWTGTVTVEIL